MANLLSVPNTVISIVNLVLLTCVSEIINNRTWVCAVENLWFFPGASISSSPQRGSGV